MRLMAKTIVMVTGGKKKEKEKEKSNPAGQYAIRVRKRKQTQNKQKDLLEEGPIDAEFHCMNVFLQ